MRFSAAFFLLVIIGLCRYVSYEGDRYTVKILVKTVIDVDSCWEQIAKQSPFHTRLMIINLRNSFGSENCLFGWRAKGGAFDWSHHWITPFVASKLKLQTNKPNQPSHPICNPGNTHGNWSRLGKESLASCFPGCLDAWLLALANAENLASRFRINGCVIYWSLPIKRGGKIQIKPI